MKNFTELKKTTHILELRIGLSLCCIQPSTLQWLFMCIRVREALCVGWQV